MISKFFVVNYMPNTPVGSLDVKINKSIKVKGQLGFPRKNQVTLRGYYGGHPPQKMVQFFAKKSQAR
jgi:hypothetical protein